jgi:hypothetical protein
MKSKYVWLMHNCIGHPISGLLSFISDTTKEWSKIVHDKTLPKDH